MAIHSRPSRRANDVNRRHLIHAFQLCLNPACAKGGEKFGDARSIMDVLRQTDLVAAGESLHPGCDVDTASPIVLVTAPW